MNRPLVELQLRIGVLAQVPDNLRKECVDIAREKRPSLAFDLASIAARKHGVDGIEAIGVAKATRWLAVIRRDHGEEVFKSVAGTLAQPTPTHTLHGHRGDSK